MRLIRDTVSYLSEHQLKALARSEVHIPSIRHTSPISIVLLISPCRIYIAINDRTLRLVTHPPSLADVHVRKLLGVLMCGYNRPVEPDWPSRDGLGRRCETKCGGILDTRTDIDYS
jgi:hypothetical protein